MKVKFKNKPVEQIKDTNRPLIQILSGLLGLSILLNIILGIIHATL